MANPNPCYAVVMAEAIGRKVSADEVALIAEQLPELVKLMWEESEED